MALLRWTDISLQRRLTIEFDGKINHVTAFHQAIRRCIRPSSSNIDADRGTSPDDLVVSNTEGRFFCYISCWCNKRTVPLCQAVTKQRKSFFTIAKEHRIMNTCHQRRILTKRLGQRNLFLFKCLCRISQVELIEHTMPPIAC